MLEVLTTCEPERNFAPHWHEEWSLGAVLGGSCRFSCAGRACTAVAGDLVAMSPRALHTAGVSGAGFRMVMAYVPHGWLAARLGWPAERVPCMPGVRHDPAAARALAGAAEQAEPARLLDCIAAIARHGAAASTAWQPLTASLDPRIERLCSVLGSADNPALDIAGLAGALGVTREHLYRLFRQALGLSPLAYGRLARLARAKALLGQGRPPAEAALLCGFADQAHFSRWFRRCLGVSPGAYRPGQAGASDLPGL